MGRPPTTAVYAGTKTPRKLTAALLNKYKIIFAFFFLIISSAYCLALGIGVVPDRIELNENGEKEESIKIINPNKIELEFEIKAEQIRCAPQTGVVGAAGSVVVVCKAELDGTKEFIDGSLIIIEARARENKEVVGVIPAVAVKVRWTRGTGEEMSGIFDVENSAGDENEELIADETGREENKISGAENKISGAENKISGALVIGDESPEEIEGKTEGETGEDNKEESKKLSVLKTLKEPEIISVIVLSLAIVFVIALGERDGKRDKRKKDLEKFVHTPPPERSP
jgi:hypothetical protein